MVFVRMVFIVQWLTSKAGGDLGAHTSYLNAHQQNPVWRGRLWWAQNRRKPSTSLLGVFSSDFKRLACGFGGGIGFL